MGRTMELSRETLESIEEYVRGNLKNWLREEAKDQIPLLMERSVRIEEELKTQRELMHQGFAHMEKSLNLMERRFEQVDKRFEELRSDMNARFEQVDKRFEQIDRRFEQVDKRFEQVDRRFEQVDKRFEQVDKRFEEMHGYATRWFTVISVVLVILSITGVVNTLF